MPHDKPTRLLLVRHAEVEENYHKIFGGQIDMNISPRGHEQAATLAQFLRGRNLHAVYASPMKRVQQTLAPTLKNHGGEQTIFSGLREIVEKHCGQNVAIFCHGGVIRMLLAILIDVPLPKTNAFEVEYASITQVALHPHMAEIELLNFTPWRDLVG